MEKNKTLEAGRPVPGSGRGGIEMTANNKQATEAGRFAWVIALPWNASRISKMETFYDEREFQKRYNDLKIHGYNGYSTGEVSFVKVKLDITQVLPQSGALAAQVKSLREQLIQAKLQLEYEHGKFGGTSSGVAVLSHIEQALRETENVE